VVGDGMVRKATHLNRGGLSGDESGVHVCAKRTEEPTRQESEPS
jgi:hypothetical protein